MFFHIVSYLKTLRWEGGRTRSHSGTKACGNYRFIKCLSANLLRQMQLISSHEQNTSPGHLKCISTLIYFEKRNLISRTKILSIWTNFLIGRDTLYSMCFYDTSFALSIFLLKLSLIIQKTQPWLKNMLTLWQNNNYSIFSAFRNFWKFSFSLSAKLIYNGKLYHNSSFGNPAEPVADSWCFMNRTWRNKRPHDPQKENFFKL